MSTHTGNTAQAPEGGDEGERFNEGQTNAHQATDSKDQRTIANRLAAAEQASNESDDSPEVAAGKIDPTLPAKMHGNEPSRGAKIDAEIQAEEEEIIKKMDAKKQN